MTQTEIIEVLRRKGFKKIETVNGIVLADVGGLDSEYWLQFQPDQHGGWLRACLYSHDPACLRDKLYQSLGEAISELMILAAVDFARFHERWRLQSAK